MGIHKNYVEISDEMAKHVDKMYGLINQYAKKNGIKLAYDDRAEVLVEALATYIVESGDRK
jgi:ferredoxin-thioredoxin reductase catalytic subunit